MLRHYDLDLIPRRGGMDTEFPGWVPAAMPGSRTAFAQVDDPEALEDRIRQAQRATLSPLEDPRSFLDPSFDDRDIHKTLFSPNVVCITVSKPGLPPLSFYDLPGIIGQAEIEEEAYTVHLIKALVTKYMLHKEALVLLTCTLENDVHNSNTAGLARELGVTDRCLGTYSIRLFHTRTLTDFNRCFDKARSPSAGLASPRPGAHLGRQPLCHGTWICRCQEPQLG